MSLRADREIRFGWAEKRDKKYRKEILLPRSYPQEKMKMTCNNGILEIKCIN